MVPTSAGAGSIVQRSLAAVAWNYAGTAARAVLQLGVQMLLARLLGPQAYGLFAVVLAVQGLGWMLAEGGVGAALIQRAVVTDDAVRQAVGAVLQQGVAIAALVMLLAPWLAGLFREPALLGPLLACGPLILLQALGCVPASLMKRNFDMKRWQMIHLLAYGIGFGLVGVPLALAGWGVWSLVIAFACQSLGAFAGAWARVRHPLQPSFAIEPQMRRFGLQVLVTNLAGWATENLDRALVGRLWGIGLLGAWAGANNLARSPATMLSHSVHSVTLATASRVQDDPPRLRRGWCAITGGLALLLLPVFTLMALAAEPLVLLLYGARWHDAVPLFQAFAVAMPLQVLAGTAGSFLWATGAVSRDMAAQLAGAGLLVLALAGLAAAGVPLATAVWAVPAAQALRAAVVYGSMARRIALPPADLLRALRGGAVLAAVGAAAWWASDLAALASPGGTLARLALAGAAGLAALLLSRGSLVVAELRDMLRGRLPQGAAGRMAGRLLGLRP